MGTLKIFQIGEPVLRQRARELSLSELSSPRWQGFIDDLIETMRDANGAGLAANQVGEAVQICALEVRDNPRYPYKPNIPLTVLVNPILTPIGDEVFENYEGCLSVPNLRGVVPRHLRVHVRALNRLGQTLNFEAAGITAGTYQHEVDHLRGTLFVDCVTDTTSLCTWDAFKARHEADFAARVKAIVEEVGS